MGLPILMKRRGWKIEEKCLGREKAAGLCDHRNHKIIVDPRQFSREYLKTLIHELTHAAFPNCTETEIIKATMLIYRGVWKKNFRRIYD